MRRRRGGPGIMSTMARTAIIAGTATAVSNKVSGASAAKQQQQQAAASSQNDIETMKAQMAQMQAQQLASATPAATGTMMDQLQQLAQLKEAGMLTDEEFAAAKGKLFSS